MTPELWAEAEKWRDELVRAAAHRLGSVDEAEDIAGDVILACVPRCRDVQALRAMLHVAMGRKCVDFHRRRVSLDRNVRKAHYNPDGYFPFVMAGVFDAQDGGRHIGAAKSRESVEFRRTGFVIESLPIDAIDLRDFTDQLSEDYAQVIWLDYLGYDKATAAQMVGLTTSAYKSRLYRARQAIRDLYAKGLVEPEPDQDGPEPPEQG